MPVQGARLGWPELSTPEASRIAQLYSLLGELVVGLPSLKTRVWASPWAVAGLEGVGGKVGYAHHTAYIPTGNTVEVNYESMVVYCWNSYKNQMDTIEKDWCNWAVISR